MSQEALTLVKGAGSFHSNNEAQGIKRPPIQLQKPTFFMGFLVPVLVPVCT